MIGEDGTLSYAELAERTARPARGLVEHGVAPGDRVALVLPNGPDIIAARFAVARAGAVAVPVSFRLHALELAQILEQSQASALITMEEFREIDALDALDRVMPGWERTGGRAATLPELRLVVTVPSGAEPRRPGVRTLRGLERDPEPGLDTELAARAAAATPQDTTTIFFTSGTTGLPKGMLSTHDMELRSAYGGTTCARCLAWTSW